MNLRYGTPDEARLHAEAVELIQKRCSQWVDEGIHPALVVLVARHGVIALYGSLGPDPDDPSLTKDAIFWLASNTKP